MQRSRAVTPSQRKASAVALLVCGLVWSLTLLLPSQAHGVLPTGPVDANFSQGAYIIDMGVSPQTGDNALKPYGLVYDLIVNHQIPVVWAIADGKTPDPDGIGDPDFVADSKSYRGGPFVIDAAFAAEAAPIVALWQSNGVVVDGPITADFVVPAYETIIAWPNAVLDQDNGAIATAYYDNAGIDGSAYRTGQPSSLTSCDDIYVMPHADPTWNDHGELVAFNDNSGYIWAACHSVSVLEGVQNPSDPDPDSDMNFLTVDGALHYGDHDDGTPAYTYNALAGSDPVMQFLGRIDGATENGSEQIFLPDSGGWRPTTKILVSDPDHADVPGSSPGEAAVLAYGRGFGDPTNGLVMYEAGHSHTKGPDEDQVAAQRAFLNLHLLAGIDNGIRVDVSTPDGVETGSTGTVSADLSSGSGQYNYTWISSCGGSFATPTGTASTDPATITTTFTAPLTGGDCTVRLEVSDSCGRASFGASALRIVESADLSLTKTDSADPIESGATLGYTLTAANLGATIATNVVVVDTLPADVSFLSATPSVGSCAFDGANVTCDLGTLNPAVVETVSIFVTVDPVFSGDLSNGAVLSADQPDSDGATPTIATEITTVARHGLTIDKAADQTEIPAAPATVNYTFAVSNEGDLELASIDVSDDTCSPVTPVLSSLFNVGDLDTDDLLDVSETWQFTCAQSISTDTTNVAFATATHPVLGVVGSPTDSVFVNVVSPAISITKTAAAASSPAGGEAAFDIVVTNIGDIDLINTAVADVAAPSCDHYFATLVVGASQTYRCTMALSLSAGPTETNTAIASAATAAGNLVSASASETITVSPAELSVSKTNDAVGPLDPGDFVTYTIDISNIGPAPHTDLVVTDAMPSGITWQSTTIDSTLDVVNEDWSSIDYVAGWTEVGETTDPTGNDIEIIEGVNANTTCTTPADCTLQLRGDDNGIGLDIDLSTKTACTIDFDWAVVEDRDDATFDLVAYDSGGAVVLDTYTIATNLPIGSFTSESVSINSTANPGLFISGGRIGVETRNDWHTGPGDDDIATIDNVVIACSATFAGGAAPNLIQVADAIDVGAGATMTVTVVGQIDPGLTPFHPRSHINTVEAESTQQSPPVHAATVVEVVVPGLGVTKTADLAEVAPGDLVTYSMEVTNEGNERLNDVVLTDPLCTPTLLSGDVNTDSILDVDEIWIYSCAVALTASTTNTVTVTAEDVLNRAVAPAIDSVLVDVVASEIVVTVVANPDPTVIRPGDTVTYNYTATTGASTEPLSEVFVSDDHCPLVLPVMAGDHNVGDLNGDGFLDAGETWQWSCTMVEDALTADLDGVVINTATGSGVDRVATTATDTQAAQVRVISPAIALSKSATPNAAVLPGTTVTYDLVVTNPGNDPLSNVVVTDNQCAPLIFIGGDTNANTFLDRTESWAYQCSKVISVDTTNVAGVQAADSLAAEVVDDATAFVDVDVAELTLGKTADVSAQLTGFAAAYSITVQNNGDTAFELANVTVTDPNCGSVTRDGSGSQALGWDDGDTTLTSGESWLYTCSATIVADLLNTASVVGVDNNTTVLSASDTHFVAVVDPGVSVVKTPDAATVNSGSTVNYTFDVMNTGGTATTFNFLSVTSVVDDHCGVPAPTLNALGRNIGDIDGDGLLGFDLDTLTAETWEYTCTALLTADTTNTVTVMVTDTLGNPIVDTAQASVIVIDPELALTKRAGNAAVGETEYILASTPVTYFYDLTNTGTGPLTSTNITDDNCAPVSPVLSGGFTTGDLDTDGVLDPGETWEFSCTQTIGVTTTNTASGTATDALAAPVTTADVTATVEVVAPAVSITKTAGGAADGQIHYAHGVGNVDFDYLITNTGDTSLTNIVVVDDAGTPALLGDDITVCVIPGPVAPVAAVSCSATITVAGDVTNIAAASAIVALPAGTPMPDIAAVIASDDATVDVRSPDLSIDKTIYSGHNSGAGCTGVDTESVIAGAAITYCFDVTNVGDTHLAGLVITDAQLSIPTLLTPTLLSLDSSPLAPGDSAVFYVEVAAGAVDVVNVASVSGNPVLASGVDLGGFMNPVSLVDTATLDVVTPAISVLQTVYAGHDAGATCPGTNSITAANGFNVTYCAVITNTGDSHLDTLQLDDAAFGLDLSDYTVLSGDPLALLGPGDVVVVYRETTVVGDAIHTVDVSALPTDALGGLLLGAATPTDSDSASVIEAVASVAIVKSLYGGHDAGASCTGANDLVVPTNHPLTYCFVVTNTSGSGISLVNVALNDPLLGIDLSDMSTTYSGTALPNGGSFVAWYETTAIADAVNLATVDADVEDALGQPIPGITAVIASDTATLDVRSVGLNLTKAVTDTMVPIGADVTFTLTATTSGDVPVGNVALSDDQCSPLSSLSGDTNLDGLLDLGESWTRTCSLAVDADMTNVAVVSGDALCPAGSVGCVPGSPIVGGALTASDSVTVRVELVDLAIAKAATTTGVTLGGGADYELVISNVGIWDAENIIVVDDLPAGLSVVAVTGAGWDCSESAGTTVTCETPFLAVGDESTVTVQTLVSPTAGAELSNRATVSVSGQVELNLNNNADISAISIEPSTPLAFTGASLFSTVGAALLAMLSGLLILVGVSPRRRSASG